MNKITVTISGPTATGKTTLAALLTWAMRKFNVMPIYNNADRTKWMNLAGDDMALSQIFAAIINGGKLPMVEIIEENTKGEEDKDPAAVHALELATKDAEIAALKAKLEANTEAAPETEVTAPVVTKKDKK